MTKKVFILAAAFAVSFSTVSGQLPLSTMQSIEGRINSSGEYLMQIGDDETVLGTPYINEDFMKGDIKMGGEWYEGVDLRYDAYSGIFEVKAEDQVYVISPTATPADSIIFNKEVYVLRDMNPGKPLKPQYLVWLYEDNHYGLGKKYRVWLKNAVPSDGYTDEQPAEFRNNPPTYYIFSDDGPHEIRNRGTIAEVLGVETRQVRRLMRKNNYRLNNEQDLVQIIKHFAGRSN